MKTFKLRELTTKVEETRKQEHKIKQNMYSYPIRKFGNRPNKQVCPLTGRDNNN